MIIKPMVNGKFNYQWQLILSSTDTDEAHITDTKSDNIQIMVCNETDAIIQEFCYSLLHTKVSKWLRRKMNGSQFAFECSYIALQTS